MRKVFPFYVWLLPLLWGVCSYLHHYFPGDENGMWLLSSIVGVLILPLLSLGRASDAMIATFIATVGAFVMGCIGFGMDRFDVRKRLWIPLFLVCSTAVLVLSIMSYSSIERAINKNGSWWAYILFSLIIGIYLSVILSVIVTATARVCKVHEQS